MNNDTEIFNEELALRCLESDKPGLFDSWFGVVAYIAFVGSVETVLIWAIVRTWK